MSLTLNLGGKRLAEINKENIQARVRVNNLRTRFFTSKGIVKAIDNLSLNLLEGETYGIVGESGSGKSVTATSIMDLIPDPPGRITRGNIFIDGFNILSGYDKHVRIIAKSETNVKFRRRKRLIRKHNYIISGIRGKKIAMVFQEPFLSLNPVLTIGEQIEEAILLHSRVSIANSIIRRETMARKDVEKFVESIVAQPDISTRKKMINRWVNEFGVPDIERPLNDLFENSTDDSFITEEAFALADAEKTGINLDQIYTARGYFDLLDRLHETNLQLIEAEATGNEEAAQGFRDTEHELKSALLKEYLSYSIQRRFLKRVYEKPFKDVARRRAIELLDRVNIAGSERVLDSYPHELSGGMQQRSMIAMALSSNPRILIADEPTTSLDVTTQAQILELFKDINRESNMSILFITHDLAVVAEMCNRVGVMYGGNLVEEGNVSSMFKDAKHPYTTGLMNSIPRAERRFDKSQRLESIPGTVPNLITPPSGCRFHPRCKFKMDICSEKKPKLVEIEQGHKVACFLYSDEVEEEIPDDFYVVPKNEETGEKPYNEAEGVTQ